VPLPSPASARLRWQAGVPAPSRLLPRPLPSNPPLPPSRTQGTQWLVWRFESDSTLADALDGALGPFPDTLEQLLFGRVDERQAIEKRVAAVSPPPPP